MGKQLAIEVMLVLVVGFALGLIGPFGTYEMSTASRLLYWIVFGVAGYAIFRPLVIVGGWLSETLRIPRAVGIGLALLIAALPMTLLVAALLFRFNLSEALRWDGIGLLYFQVWLIGFLTNGFFQLLFRKPAAATAAVMPTDSAPASVEPAFTARLPAGFGPLLALKGEDHYVRAISATREELILIRLRDAIAELGGVEGLQVHRSWWVAKAGVSRVRRDGRTAVITLTTGAEVAVARNKMAELRALSWI